MARATRPLPWTKGRMATISAWTMDEIDGGRNAIRGRARGDDELGQRASRRDDDGGAGAGPRSTNS